MAINGVGSWIREQEGEDMEWARTLAYVTGTVDQELLLRNEYLAAENGILKAQLKGCPKALRRRASEARRDWPSIGPQIPQRGGDYRPARHHLGMVPKADCSQIRWIAGTSNPGPATDRQRS